MVSLGLLFIPLVYGKSRLLPVLMRLYNVYRDGGRRMQGSCKAKQYREDAKDCAFRSHVLSDGSCVHSTFFHKNWI